MSNYRDGYLEQGSPIGALAYDLTLIADNTAIDVSACSLLRLSSDSVTATARTFTLSAPANGYAALEIVFESGSSTSAELLSSGNCKLSATWSPLQYDALSLRWDGTYWVEKSRKASGGSFAGSIVNADISASAAIAFSKLAALSSGNILVGSAGTVPTSVAMSGDATIIASGALTIANLAVTNAKVAAAAAIDFTKLATLTSGNILVGNGSNAAASVAVSGDVTLANTGAVTLAPAVYVRTAAITLTAANIAAMNGAAVNLIAAPGVGKMLIVDDIEWVHTYSTAAYTNGGVIAFQYTASTAIAKIAAAMITEGSSSTRYIKPSYLDIDASTGSTPVSTAALQNLGVEITNASAAFASGNASNIVKITIRYHVYTVAT